jgi:hypothetical protein
VGQVTPTSNHSSDQAPSTAKTANAEQFKPPKDMLPKQARAVVNTSNGRITFGSGDCLEFVREHIEWA